MLFSKRTAGVRYIRKMSLVIFSGALLITAMLVISSCTATKGSIVILENPNGTGFTMDFKEWSAKNKCELSLTRDDVLQIEVSRESGEIALMVSGKNGSEPYTGNDLESGIFTVAVSETDEYVIRITGKDATGKITVKNLESEVK